MVPSSFWAVISFIYGICIGSFLNVVIYRMPLGLSLSHPPSHCPRCQRRLTALDLIPLLSFLMLGCKCRGCKQPISWRYFNIELLTGLLFLAVFLRFHQDAATCIALMIFTAVMVPVYFIDMATFTIPDELNLLALAVALGRDFYGIAVHEPGHELLWGWLPRSILGAVVGTLIFGVVRVLGWLWKRQEAMGLGDPLLARAMGAMLISITPVGMNLLRLFPIWVFGACISGVVIGIGLITVRTRAQQSQTISQESEVDEEALPPSSLKQQLLEIGYCLILGDGIDLINDVLHPSRRSQPQNIDADLLETAPPAPTAIPFGPFLVIGFLAAVFVGEMLTSAYLSYAIPKPMP